GFVGVDVFFVISGYLITLIVWKEIEDGRFSIARFYERRARRILPALYSVLTVSILGAWVLMLPEQLANFGQSVVATILFSNNVLLMMTAGYWDLSVHFKPLVHTWSLGVEEQFYVLFPILLLGASVWLPRKIMLWALAALFAISLFLTVPLHGWSANANFYLVISRAWELLAGSLIALTIRDSHLKFGNQILSLIGLMMILAATILLDERAIFPGPAALVPVAG